MKRLYVIRHAKSSWKDLSLADWERPLNKRGTRDIPKMGEYLKARQVDFDNLVSSHAVRAQKTAQGIAESLNYPQSEISLEPRLYHASVRDIIRLVHQFQNEDQSVAIFGHNPGFTEFVNHICNASIVNVPTCGICSITLPISNWSDLRPMKGKLQFFVAPKTIPKT